MRAGPAATGPARPGRWPAGHLVRLPGIGFGGEGFITDGQAGRGIDGRGSRGNYGRFRCAGADCSESSRVRTGNLRGGREVASPPRRGNFAGLRSDRAGVRQAGTGLYRAARGAGSRDRGGIARIRGGRGARTQRNRDEHRGERGADQVVKSPASAREPAAARLMPWRAGNGQVRTVRVGAADRVPPERTPEVAVLCVPCRRRPRKRCRTRSDRGKAGCAFRCGPLRPSRTVELRRAVLGEAVRAGFGRAVGHPSLVPPGPPGQITRSRDRGHSGRRALFGAGRGRHPVPTGRAPGLMTSACAGFVHRSRGRAGRSTGASPGIAAAVDVPARSLRGPPRP